MDITLPSLEGGNLIREIQHRADWRERPCLVVASTPVSANEQTALAAAGVVLVLDASSQPLEALLATVEALLQPTAGKAPHA